ncbi:MAG: trigger factor [Crocinitomicaceae bacterium]|nr:trigger factor [Crocinitomicaceae bacterium]
MDIVREDIDALNALLRVKIKPEDYKEKVDQTLADYRKKANVPGFRKGKIPMGVIKKQYGKPVLADELNKVINDSLYDFINKNELNILGNPIPKEDEEIVGDWDNPGEFEFVYEIGFSPEFNLSLSAKSKYNYYKVKVDKKLVDQQIEDIRKRYGKLISEKEVSEKDMILGQFVELDDSGAVKEGGVMNSSTISMEFVEDKKVQKELLGKKVGDVVVLDPKSVSKGESDMAAMLGIKAEELASISNKFNFTINEVKRMEPADLNEEFFTKIFPDGSVKTEADMRKKVEEDLAKMFDQDSERILSRDVSEDLVEKTKMDFPNDFLKKWILASSKEDVTMEMIENDYDNYTTGLKWQLIQNKIFKDNEIKIESEEVINYTKGLLVNQYAQYGLPAPEENELIASARKVLENRDEANRIYDMMSSDKLLDFFKETVKLNVKEVSYDDFVKIASGEK